jgi:HK97 family phage major capsid protein/HK97 family phage prohead protease
MIVHKSAAVVQVGGDFHFVMSDASVDRLGDVIEPAGWELAQFRAHPIALFNHGKQDPLPIGTWSDVRVEKGQLRGKLNFAAPGTSPRIDEMRSLLEQGILRAASVGFEPIEDEPLQSKSRGRRYKRQRLVECSLVTIPANANALAIAKSLNISDDTLNFVFGEQATEGDGMVRRHIGEHAGTPPGRKPGIMTTLSKRIEDAQNDINKDRDVLAQLLAQEERDVAAEDEINARIETKQNEMASLKRSEANLALRTIDREIEPLTVTAPAIARRPFSMPKKEVKALDLFVRKWVVELESQLTNKDPEKILEKRYPDCEGTRHLVTRAAVAGATTTTAGWAAELVSTGDTEFLEALQPFSVFPSLAMRGQSLTFNANQGIIRIPSRATTPSIAGSFVGEGAPIPVRRLGLTSITLSPKKMAVISVFTREISKYSNPQIEGLVRREIINDTAMTLDSLLLDAVAGSSVRPAGLLNGVTPLTATAGGGATAILGDIKKLLAPFDAANAGRNVVLIMNSAQARSLQMTPGPDNTFGWTSNILGEVTIVSSTNVAAGVVIAVDAEDFVASSGAPEFDTSGEAILHMEDTSPGQITTGAAAVSHPSVSMFQTAQIAVRMMMDVTWAMRRTGMVQTISAVTW